MRRVLAALCAAFLLASPAFAGGSEPFGLESVIAADFRWRGDWRRILEVMGEEETKKLLVAFTVGAPQEAGARAEWINNKVNLLIRKTSSSSDWRIWPLPAEVLQIAEGNCLDAAILKFAALWQGTPANDLRLIVGEKRGGRHAVVAVRVSGRWLVLDNVLGAKVVEDRVKTGFTPVLVLSGSPEKVATQ